MTLNELRYIVAVARDRHFGRAADQCFVSQPTLSVAVRKLENELGVSLFERGQGEVSVTPIGEQVVAQAQRVLEQAEAIRDTARFGQDQLAAPLRVAAIYTIGPYLFPRLVLTLNAEAPRIPLIIEENYTALLSEKLKRGEQDVVVISLPFNEPGIQTRPLYEEPFVVLLPAGHRWEGRREIDPKGLEDERVLLLGAGHCFRDQVMEACPGCLRPVPAEQGGIQGNFEGGSLETMRYMVASGLGVTVLPSTATGPDCFPEGMVCVKPFKSPPPSRTVALAWRRSFPRPKAIDALAQAIMDCGLQGVKRL